MILTSGNLTLRSAEVKDAPTLGKWWRDGTVMAHAGFPNGLPITDEKIEDNIKTKAGGINLMILEVGGVAIGETHYKDKGDGICAIGIKICDFSQQGKGYGSRFLTMLIRELFGDLGFTQITLDTGDDNIPAQKTYERQGFVKTGEVIEWTDSVGEHRKALCYKLDKNNFM
ncbi:MAG: GNAT family N-acetyltransferase [Defluviitaleaceae bacterium]|nr:GNAT family N-acetyltransferase [Defluviitaleaceae bacterium]